MVWRETQGWNLPDESTRLIIGEGMASSRVKASERSRRILSFMYVLPRRGMRGRREDLEGRVGRRVGRSVREGWMKTR